MKARAEQPRLSHPEFRGVLLTKADALDGLALSSEAMWNQTEVDWSFLLSYGRAVGFEDSTGELVASTVIIPYENRIGWICMVLVSAKARRRGLARKLLDYAIDATKNAGLIPMLDATPDGRTVYVGVGFRDLFPITRWIGQPQPSQFVPRPTQTRVQPLVSDSGLERWRRLDKLRFGAERGALLELLQNSRPDLALQVGPGDGQGYCLGRVGRNRPQIGPMVAESELVALELLGETMGRVADFAFLDLIEGYPLIEQYLESRGWKRQRAFTRMTCGDLPAVRPANVFAIAGPEYG